MSACVIECTRKLALWYTKTFKPIMTHEELEPIMATLGFIAQPEKIDANGIVWKEYKHAVGSHQCLPTPPLPKLPSHKYNGGHRIDGLHVYTYRAFIDAVKFYLKMNDISDMFHIRFPMYRGMMLQPSSDRNMRFCRMEENVTIFVYKQGTLDQDCYDRYHLDTNNVDSSDNGHDSNIIRDKGNNISVGIVAPLTDIIVSSGHLS